MAGSRLNNHVPGSNPEVFQNLAGMAFRSPHALVPFGHGDPLCVKALSDCPPGFG